MEYSMRLLLFALRSVNALSVILFVDQCKVWDSEDLIDLDSFNTNVFFEILLTQSLAMTTKLSQFKEEVSYLHVKVKELWIYSMQKLRCFFFFSP